MKEIDLVKRGEEWVGISNGRAVRRTRARLKPAAIKNTAEKAKAAPGPVTVKIHDRDGNFQEERTYPRKADPRRSKG